MSNIYEVDHLKLLCPDTKITPDDKIKASLQWSLYQKEQNTFVLCLMF